MKNSELTDLAEWLMGYGILVIKIDYANETLWIDLQFIDDVRSILDEAGDLLLRKQIDYGPTNISRAPGGPLNGLRVRMHDKIARINNLLDKNIDPQNESLRDSFIDLLNYSAIAIMVLENKWPNE